MFINDIELEGRADRSFRIFIEEMLGFFESGKPIVPGEQTLEIMAILEAGQRALKTPDKWTAILG